MLNRLLIFSILVVTALSGNAQTTFTVTGKITGEAEGMKVYLHSFESSIQKISDTAVIKNGMFIIKGKLRVPLYCQLIIDRTPAGEQASEKNWVSSNFYLENSAITYQGNIKTMPTFFYKQDCIFENPVITGSKMQDEYETFKKGQRPINEELKRTNDEYLKVYHLPAMEGKFNTAEGIKIVRQINALEDESYKYTMDYIKENPKSVVSYDQATYMLAGYSTNLTQPQINNLVTIINKGWAGTANMKAFKKAAIVASKTALGKKYQNFQFTTADGKKVMLSKYVPTGKIVMLEFWASWCGPCRGEIPHLKHLNETKSDVFQIVSISLDEKESDWKKAMKEEGMVWTQLNDPHGFEGEIAKAYNIFGIPQSLILDKDGRIMKVGLRGAFLDTYIEDFIIKK
jgi:thiol-disulfide isomerase/thioredoxin